MSALTSPKESQYLTESTPLATVKIKDNTNDCHKVQTKPKRKFYEETNGDAITSSYVRGYN